MLIARQPVPLAILVQLNKNFSGAQSSREVSRKNVKRIIRY